MAITAAFYCALPASLNKTLMRRRRNSVGLLPLKSADRLALLEQDLRIRRDTRIDDSVPRAIRRIGNHQPPARPLGRVLLRQRHTIRRRLRAGNGYEVV